jgi:Glycosyltransferase family 87
MNTTFHLQARSAKARQDGLIFFVLGALLFLSLGIALGRAGSETSNSMLDFKGIYYPAKCLVEHCDPYNQRDVERIYLGSVGEAGTRSNTHLQVTTLGVNLPTTFMLITPLALLPWSLASLLWMILTAGAFVLAAWLIWNLSGDQSLVVSGALLGLLLANSVLLLALGNTAGLVVSLCVIAVWCFIKERFVLAGILCLAVSLSMKPHDSGLVWLYFLLAGGLYRKRALQTLALVLAIVLFAVVWTSYCGPHWVSEIQSNLATVSAQNGINDPGPTATHAARDANMVINLQAAVSILNNDPRFYDAAGYLISASLLLIWLVATIRAERSASMTRLAVAAIVPITLLATYHRPHDAGLLMLTVPACGLLCSRGGQVGRLALIINFAAFLLVGTIPLAILVRLGDKLHLDSIGLMGKVLTMILARPISIVLLLMSVFYLWVYSSAVRNKAPAQPILQAQ